MSFAENFNYCLDSREYTAYRFSKIIGANIQTVINWKSGTSTPRYDTRQKIADHFGITMAELDGEELPTLPPQGAKKAPTEISERELDMSAKDLTALQKDAVNYVLSLSPEKLSIFLKLGRAAFDEDVKDD